MIVCSCNILNAIEKVLILSRTHYYHHIMYAKINLTGDESTVDPAVYNSSIFSQIVEVIQYRGTIDPAVY